MKVRPSVKKMCTNVNSFRFLKKGVRLFFGFFLKKKGQTNPLKRSLDT